MTNNAPKQSPEAKAQNHRDIAKGIMASLVECTDSPREACKILMAAIGGVISMGGLKFGKKVEVYTYKELETMLKTIVKVCFQNQRKRLKKESKNSTPQTDHLKH